MPELANYADIQRALQEDARTILRQMQVGSVQLSMPLDGKGARIRVSVKGGERVRIPKHVNVEIDGRHVRIPIEVVPDYEEYEAY